VESTICGNIFESNINKTFLIPNDRLREAYLT